MHGVGELFGQSVDAVLRKPRAIVVPFLVDVAMLGLGTLLFWYVATVSLLFPQGYRLPDFPVAVPHALPTVGDIMGPEPALHAFGLPVTYAAIGLVVLGVPLLAYAEAGFLGVLKAVYLQPIDPTREGRHADAWSRISEAFHQTARKRYRVFFFLRAIQAGLAIVALLLPRVVRRFGNYGLGVLAVDVLLLYAPYAALESGKGAFAAIRESVQLVSDHLATTLVSLLFGFLLTGGLGLLLGRLGDLPALVEYGPWGPVLASLLYAPVGTALSLFLYIVFLGFRPADTVPESAPAPEAAPASPWPPTPSR